MQTEGVVSGKGREYKTLVRIVSFLWLLANYHNKDRNVGWSYPGCQQKWKGTQLC